MQTINLKDEAQVYFTAHYPKASAEEIQKQVEDWEHKISVGKSLVTFFTERVGTVEHKKILDVGFGNGGICIAFNQAGAVMSGLDVDQALKDIADRHVASHGAHVDLRIYDGTNFPYDDDSFDAVVSFSVLEHVTDAEKVISEMLRVLKPGGRILLTLPNKYYPKETHTLLYGVSYLPHNLANAYIRLFDRSPLEDDNLHFYSYFDIVYILKKTGVPYELVYKDMTQASGVKKFVARVLQKMNIHYTVFLKQLIFIIEKK